MRRQYRKFDACQPNKLRHTSGSASRSLPNCGFRASSSDAARSTTGLTLTHGSMNIRAEGGPERKVLFNGP